MAETPGICIQYFLGFPGAETPECLCALRITTIDTSSYEMNTSDRMTRRGSSPSPVMPSQTFEAFFTKATGKTPYRYQTCLAERPIESRLINVPTGCGKTAAAILAWLWQRTKCPGRTPRRLAYCLPMRTLVEQTRDCALDWLDAARISASTDTMLGRLQQ
jgi:CRISPR/Cas system-associated endonuclease/helicase Cas3